MSKSKVAVVKWDKSFIRGYYAMRCLDDSGSYLYHYVLTNLTV